MSGCVQKKWLVRAVNNPVAEGAPMNRRLKAIAILIAAIVSLTTLARVGAVQEATRGIIPQPHLGLVNANVLDIRTGNIRANTTVVIRNGKIVSVGNDSVPTGADIMNLDGRYLVPGFMDGHVHYRDIESARRAVQSGVTTNKSANAGGYRDVSIRNMVKQGYLEGPDMLAAGVFVSPTPSFESILADSRLYRFMTERADTPENIALMVRVNLEHGVDWIKTRSSERAGGPATDPRELVYTEDQLRVMVEEASTKNVPIQSHVQGDVGAAPAIKAGVRMIEHGWYLSEESLELMQRHGTYWDPTTPALMDVAEPHNDYDNVVAELRAPYMISNVKRNLRRARELGVKVVTGTDTRYGPNSVSRIWWEINNLVVWGGFTPLEALQAATIVSAEAYKLDGITGAIEPNLEADLIAFDRNPLEDILIITEPVLVISNGRIALNRQLIPTKPGRVPGN